MRHRFLTADVFTDRIFEGNQLAVLPDGRGLTTVQMQRTAREFNFSETVFVLPPESSRHTRRIRIFTPNAELPFAGHPTIGTAHVLAAIGEITLERETTDIVIAEGVGPVSVTVRARDGHPVSARLRAPRPPEFGPPPPPRADLAAMLSVEQGYEMGRPSLLEIEAEKRHGAITETGVGGSSVLVSDGLIEIP